MTGMKTLIGLRQRHIKPSAVFVDLVQSIAKYDAEAYSFAENAGIVSINIAKVDSLNDIDFRPLVGLAVFASDNTNNPERYRYLCELIAEAPAARIERLT